MRIQHNILAMNAYRNYTNNTSALSKNLEKLSSGYKINRAGDDAAGLAISEKMRAQITGLDAAQKNVKDGISLVKTAEGALSEVHDMLNRMVYLATQSANGTYDGTDRVQLQKELDQLRTEINRISEASNFNGIKLLDGSMDTSGGVKNVDSLSRMLQTVGTGVENIGKVTILDSDPLLQGKNTTFEMEFRGLTTGGATTPTPPPETKKATYVGVSAGGVGTYAKFGIKLTDDVVKEINDALQANKTYTLKIGEGSGTKYFTFYPSGTAPAATTVSFQGSGTFENPYWTNKAAGLTKEDLMQSIGNQLQGQTIKMGDLEFTCGGYVNGAIDFTATTMGTFTVGGVDKDSDEFEDYLDTNAVTGNQDTGTPATEGAIVGTNFTDKKDIASASAKVIIDLKLTNNGQAINWTDGASLSITMTGGDTIKLKYSATSGWSQIGGTGRYAMSGGSFSVSFDGRQLTLTKATKGATTLTAASFAISANGVTAASKAGGAITIGTVSASVNAASTYGNNAGTAPAKLTGYLTRNKLAANGVIQIGSKTYTLTTNDTTNLSNATLATLLNTKFAGGSKYTITFSVSGDYIKFEITERASKAGTTGMTKDSLSYTPPAGSSSASAGVTPAEDYGVAPANNNGIAPTSGTGSASISFDVKLGGHSLVDGVKVKASASDKEIAQAVFEALAEKLGIKDVATNTALDFQFAANGANYKVTLSGTKLTFLLQDPPSKDNIKGNWDWNISGDTDKFAGGHTAGVTVHTQGRVTVENQSANTVFRIDSGDIKDGTKISITDHTGNTSTVTLYVGRNGTDVNGTTNSSIYLTAEEAKNLDYVLGKISEAFSGMETGDLVIGVNDKSNGQGHMGLTVTHAHGSGLTQKDAYLTMADFAKVFSINVPRNPEGTGLTLQIGDTADAYNQLAVSIGACDSSALGLDGVDISTQSGAQKAIESIKNAINYVSDVRGTLGATQNRLEHTANNLSVMSENIQDAESTIRDTDVANEMMSYVKNNILIQSAQAMLAQANQIPQGVLQLLG